MSKGSLYKSFTAKPFKIVTMNGDEVDYDHVMSLIAKDVITVNDIAQWHLNSDITIQQDIQNYEGFSNNHKIGEALGVWIPDSVYALGDRGKSGKSRLEWMFQDKVVSEAKSWIERSKAADGNSERYISQGWKRTANGNKPTFDSPKVRLSAADEQYAKILNDPVKDGFIEIKLVVWGEWHKLYFEYDSKRFSDADKICLPDITLDKNRMPLFHFANEYKYIYKHIEDEYVTSVDVNKGDFAVVTVVRKDGSLAHCSRLSRRVDSLSNSIKATTKQIAHLHRKRSRIEPESKEYSRTSQEIAEHRQANSRKKKELAIIAAQEISNIAHEWGNTLVIFEDLSWIENTMQNGRWNRGWRVGKMDTTLCRT